MFIADLAVSLLAAFHADDPYGRTQRPTGTPAQADAARQSSRHDRMHVGGPTFSANTAAQLSGGESAWTRFSDRAALISLNATGAYLAAMRKQRGAYTG